MAELYQGRADRWLVQPVGEASPYSQSADTAISANDIAKRHLTGATGLGVYPVLDDGNCTFAVIDLDNKPERPNPVIRLQVKNICMELRKHGLDHRVCTSQSGRGYHIAIYFEEFVPAWLVRNVITAICRMAKVPSVEVFPKQDELSPGQVGNAVRLPLFRESRFVDPRNGWKELDALDCLRSVELVSRDKLGEIAKQLQVGKRKRLDTLRRSPGSDGLSAYVQKLLVDKTSLLAKRWAGDTAGLEDGTRSALVMAITCCLIRKYVPTAEVESALRHWCSEYGYEKGKRQDWLDITIGKAYAFVQQSHETARSRLADEYTGPIARQIKNARRHNKSNKKSR